MNNKLSDDQIDRLAAHFVKEFPMEESELDEIADSPQLFWQVRKNVAAAAVPPRKGWLASFGWMIPAFGIVAVGICFGAAVWMFSAGESAIVADNNRPAQTDLQVLPDAVGPENSRPVIEVTPKTIDARTEPRIRSEITSVRRKLDSPKAPQVARRKSQNSVRPETETPAAERKTDFIALSYAGNDSGGQLVRVKVPSAMMVTLGVVSEVDKDAAMVSAEVVVGDDGLARAIRFIR